LSKNRKRKTITTQQRMQRSAAGKRSAQVRSKKSVVDAIDSYLLELKKHVPALFKLEEEFCPRETPPWGKSSSIVSLGHVSGNSPERDPQIFTWLNELKFSLWLRVQEAKNMRIARGQDLTDETPEKEQPAHR